MEFSVQSLIRRSDGVVIVERFCVDCHIELPIDTPETGDLQKDLEVAGEVARAHLQQVLSDIGEVKCFYGCDAEPKHQCPRCKKRYCDACYEMFLPVDPMFWVKTAMMCAQCHYEVYGAVRA